MEKIIAVIFDFDDTLAPDSTNGFLEKQGIDTNLFWREVQTLTDDDWDPVPAYLYKMLQVSSSNRLMPFTREAFSSWGTELPLYKGVRSIFGRLHKQVEEIDPNIKIEYYCISSGIGDIVRNTSISDKFSEIWSCEFHYDGEGKIDFPKKIISFTDKTRYIFQISKGFIGQEYRGNPLCVNKKVKREDIRIPFDQMIFVGDGMTDVPCFSLVMKQGGTAIGVYDKSSESKWKQAWGFAEQGRVVNVVSADYGLKSDLSDSLAMAVRATANRITMKEKTYQG